MRSVPIVPLGLVAVGFAVVVFPIVISERLQFHVVVQGRPVLMLVVVEEDIVQVR
jgi:hypothetical protein